MELTWRQTSKYSMASGCGNYRIAKCKGQDGWLYLPYTLIDNKWARKFEIQRGEPEDQARMVVTVYKIDLPESRQQGLGL